MSRMDYKRQRGEEVTQEHPIFSALFDIGCIALFGYISYQLFIMGSWGIPVGILVILVCVALLINLVKSIKNIYYKYLL